MKRLMNQRGLAALEVVIVAAVVAIFATVAVSRMARIVDKVTLDYEMKHLLSELNFARSIGRNSEYSASIFGRTSLKKQNGEVTFKIRETDYFIDRSAQGHGTYHKHTLPDKFKFEGDNNISIEFNNASQSDSGNLTLEIVSRFGYRRYIYFENAGRWSGDWNNRYPK